MYLAESSSEVALAPCRRAQGRGRLAPDRGRVARARQHHPAASAALRPRVGPRGKCPGPSAIQRALQPRGRQPRRRPRRLRRRIEPAHRPARPQRRHHLANMGTGESRTSGVSLRATIPDDADLVPAAVAATRLGCRLDTTEASCRHQTPLLAEPAGETFHVLVHGTGAPCGHMGQSADRTRQHDRPCCAPNGEWA